MLFRRLSTVFLTVLFLVIIPLQSLADEEMEEASQELSPETQACIGCHSMFTPGIVQDWLTSRHSKTAPQQALGKPDLRRRVSAGKILEQFSRYAVGCFECHSLNPAKHRDNFEHMGFKINVVVSPNDCRTCHPLEVEQYEGSKKAHAIKNLLSNPVYHTLVKSTDGLTTVENGKIVAHDPSDVTLRETCLGCHGTRIEVKGMKKVMTKMGEIPVPHLTNWPNQGVGRENPDGSLGACSACHPRHGFSIEVARKPYTCAQCHLEPDVPAWNVYKESKHGNIYASKEKEWKFSSVPWIVGTDFQAPTCASCHNSLLVSPTGDVIAERTHDFGARLWVRLFGLVYAHPQPRSGNTTIIKNKDKLPLPTAFTGEPAREYLIDRSVQEKRLSTMKTVCKSCHSTDWVDNHFEKLDTTTKETNQMTFSATMLMVGAWENGIEDKTNPFDESIEKLWVKQWLFYANSIRYASAMTGAPDYAAFKNGWWELSHNLQQMKDQIELKKLLPKGKKK